MKIYLASAGVAEEFSCIPAFSAYLAGQREPNRHSQVTDPSAAELILFPECHQLPGDWRLRAIRESALAKEYPGKVAIYDERSRPWCSLPGIYVSMPAPSFVSRWQIASSYYACQPPFLRLANPLVEEADLLFSFVGSSTHRCREPIFALAGSRSVVERTDGFLFYDPASERFEERRLRYAEVMLRSKFVLCPRGHATSSIRVYETMSSGRVPVIIADAWVPPVGPDWSSFSISWPEDRVAELPAYLANREDEAAEMGVRAKAAFGEWFSSDIALTRQIDQLEALMSHGGFPGFPAHGVHNAQFFRVARGTLITRIDRVRHHVPVLNRRRTPR